MEAGQLHGEHGRAVLERNLCLPARLALGVDEGQDAEDVLPRRGQDEEPVAVPYGPALVGRPLQDLRLVSRARLRIRVGSSGSCPGAQVAVPVLHGDGVAGQLVHGLSDPLLSLSRHCHVGEALVDGRRGLERRDGGGEGLVRRPKLDRGGPLPRIVPGVGERDPCLLRQYPQDELLVGAGLLVGRHDQVAEVSFEAA